MVISVLVNGSEIFRTLKGGKPAPGETQTEEGGTTPDEGGSTPEEGEDEDTEPRELRLQVVTQNARGETSTTLDVSEDDCIYIQAWCEEVGKGGLGDATNTIAFSLVSGAQWVSMAPAEAGAGVRAVCVAPTQASYDDDQDRRASVRVSAVLAQQAVSAVVDLDITHGVYRVQFC